MRIVNKTVKFKNGNRKLYFEQFGSYDEYLKIIEQRDKENAHSKNTLEVRARDKIFAGVSSYEEARNLLVNGWDKEVEYLKKQFQKEVSSCDVKKVSKSFNDVVGYMPIVPNAILGLPHSMINTRKDMKKTKVIKFLIDMNRSWTTTPEEIIDKFSKILAKISVLERSGYRCRIEIFGSFNKDYGDNTIVAHTVLIKSENQLFDLRRITFPIVHSAMQRVFGFGWENSLPIKYEDYHTCGLGKALEYWGDESRKTLLNAINEANEKIVFLNMRSDENHLVD